MEGAVVHTRGGFTIHQRGPGGAPFSIQVGEQVIQTESAEDALSHVITALQGVNYQVATLRKMRDSIQEQELTSLSLQNMVNLILEQRINDNDDHNLSQYKERLVKEDYVWCAHYYAKIQNESVRKELISALANTDTAFRLGFALKEKEHTGLIGTDFAKQIADIILHERSGRFQLTEKDSKWVLFPAEFEGNYFRPSSLYPAPVAVKAQCFLEHDGKDFRIVFSRSEGPEMVMGVAYSESPFSGPGVVIGPRTLFQGGKGDENHIADLRSSVLVARTIMQKAKVVDSSGIVLKYLGQLCLLAKKGEGSFISGLKLIINKSYFVLHPIMKGWQRPTWEKHTSNFFSGSPLDAVHTEEVKVELERIFNKTKVLESMWDKVKQTIYSLSDSDVPDLERSETSQDKIEMDYGGEWKGYDDRWRLIPQDGGTFKLVCTFLGQKYVLTLGKERHELSRWVDLEKENNKTELWTLTYSPDS